MRINPLFCALCIAFIGNTVFAQSQKELGRLMRERNEYYFTLSVNEPAEIQSISRICSVDGTDGHTVVAYANQQEYSQLLGLGYQPNLQTPPSLLEEAEMWDGNRATYEWNSYPTYSQYVAMMQGFPRFLQVVRSWVSVSTTAVPRANLNSFTVLLSMVTKLQAGY